MTDQPLAVSTINAPATTHDAPEATRLNRLSPAGASLLVIGAFVILRLISACFIGLGTDESYSIAVARDLRASYFDHPPMHYWLAHLVEPLVGVSRGGRLPFIALFAGSSWLMFLLGRRLFGAWAGLWAVLALNLSGFFTVAAGAWVLPDGPLIFFLLATTTVLAYAAFDADPEAPPPSAWRRPALSWILVGVFAGLAGLSKYQAALFCLGLGLFLITTARGRRQLLTPWPYLAGLLALAVLSPVLWWNATHHWASFAFQAGRGAPGKLRPLGPLAALGGQAALLLPWIFLPMAWAGVVALRLGPKAERGWFCVVLALPTIAVFTLTPLLGPLGLPHWSMPGWLLLFPLLGALLAQAAQTRAWPRTWVIGSLAFVLAVGVLASADADTGWLGQRYPKLFRHGDPTAESIEWRQLRPVIAADPWLRRPAAFVVALKWNEAGKIDQAVGDLAPVAMMSDDPREFAYRHPLSGYIGHDALIIGRLDTLRARLPVLTPYFQSVTMRPPISIGRDGHGEILIGVAEARGLIRPYDATR